MIFAPQGWGESPAIPHNSDTTKRAVDVITGKATTVPKTSALVMTITHGDR